MSKIPTTASSPAAVVTGMPWSCAEGMKCGCTRPLVDAPQIMKLTASTQNTRVRPASASPRRAVRAAPVRTGSTSSAGVPPYGATPTSRGRSRSRNATRGTTASAAAVVPSAAVRQPHRASAQATSGRNTSCPVAPPAVRMPDTRPRRATNQRPLTVATSDSAIEPVPRPTSTPHSSTSCQLACMNTVSPLPVAVTSRATTTTRRMPKRSMSAAANGAVSPYSAMFTATAAEMVDTDQPNSACSGSISTPGTARNAAAPTSARKVTAATHQAGWMRWIVGAPVRETAVLVTVRACRTVQRTTSGPMANMCKDPAMTREAARPTTPHEVVVLALPDPMAFELGLAGTFLGGAVDADERPLYRVRVATLDGGPVRTSGGFSVLPEHDASVLATADTVVVPGIHLPSALPGGRLPADAVDALRAAAGRARLVSICTGSFALAAAGILDGRPATTHWLHAERFAALFPRVRL